MSYDPTWGNEEAYCPSHESFTTDYNSNGECRECGTPVQEDRDDE